MQDLVDTHRQNIAKAGLALAEAIKTATITYTSDVAASEAVLEVRMAARVAAFNGVGDTPPPAPAPTDAEGEPAPAAPAITY